MLREQMRAKAAADFVSHPDKGDQRRSFNLVELWAGIGAFGSVWTKCGGTVVGVSESKPWLEQFLKLKYPQALFSRDFTLVILINGS